MKTKQLLTILLFTLSFNISVIQAQKWEMADVPLSTPWAEDVSPDNVLPEYPRPMMKRVNWINLNGLWEFQKAYKGDAVPVMKKLEENILVPFPWESALSGIRKQLDTYRAWYKRSFDIPANWKNRRILLHFGAVDWEATVYVNGKCVGTHRGGFDPFSFDITDYLNDRGDQELIVEVWDPGNDKAIAAGKQVNNKFDDPAGYSYCPASGIWQTVWLEPVADFYITDYHITPDLDTESIIATVNASELIRDSVEIIVMEGEKEISRGKGRLNREIYVDVPDPKTWSPDSPFLYDVKVRLFKDEMISDEVLGYFGMRKISLQKVKGIQRIFLNNEFLFQMGPLDQGYWPDGIFTAPTDEALRWDIEMMKEFGFNMVRKHIKVEPQRWYYWCDKLGILVWQDMPSTWKTRTEEEKTQFEWELDRMVKSFWNHPSIINWIVFNEHWGLYDTERLTENVMKLDPSRLVTGNSGIDAGKPDIDYEVGHIIDNHSYRPPDYPFGTNKRANVCGEYGAIGYKIDGHIWDKDGPWVHHNYAGKEEATAEYERFIGMLKEFMENGLSAGVYTQWTDLENEMNGIYTYDRKVIKLDKERITKANKSTYEEEVEIPTKDIQ